MSKNTPVPCPFVIDFDTLQWTERTRTRNYEFASTGFRHAMSKRTKDAVMSGRPGCLEIPIKGVRVYP